MTNVPAFPLDNPEEMARILREQAEQTESQLAARFFRDLADDYEALAKQKAE